LTLSASEIESLRHHLNYGNMGVAALPYTPDGFWSVFDSVISPYLGTGTEDASVTAVTAGAVAAITITSDASAFVVYSEAVIDVGDNAEIVQVQAYTTGATETVTAYFAKAHNASGYPVATMSGKARLRLLIHDANRAWRAIAGSAVGATAGLKSVDKGDVEWFKGDSALRGRVDHYENIQAQIAQLCRVAPARSLAGSGGAVRLERY